ncbi:uncharacterized protein [Clytia hemisphaerica]|uniref:uncharacterized protein n=1 Tax=Clytia hemisphaerica TaxID=252671 RepID=UPI0034D76FC3
MREAKEKRDDVSGVKENTVDKRETASREEKATVIMDTVVMDNDSLRDLVDLVVRAIDEEARREEKKDMSGRENSKREIIQEEKRALHTDRKEKKEVIEEKKRDETKELCNTRKRECMQKKSSEISADTKVEEAKSTKTEKKSIEDKIESKKTAEKSVAVEKKVEKKIASAGGENLAGAKKKKEDSNEIREMVEEILNGKNDEEREAFASLLESVFERTTKKSVAGTSADQQKEKKNKDE